MSFKINLNPIKGLKAIGRNPLPSLLLPGVGSYATALAPDAMKKFSSGAKNLLLGKKDTGTDDKRIGLDQSLEDVVHLTRPLQESAARGFGAELDYWKSKDPSKLAASAVGIQEANRFAEGNDAQRAVTRGLAQRGLGSSSLGLRALMGENRSLARDVGSIRASRPMQELEFANKKLSGINMANTGLSNILNSPGAQTTVIPGMPATGMRSGGLLGLALPIAGAVGGGMMTGGSPHGIAAGMQVGAGASEALRGF